MNTEKKYLKNSIKRTIAVDLFSVATLWSIVGINIQLLITKYQELSTLPTKILLVSLISLTIPLFLGFLAIKKMYKREVAVYTLVEAHVEFFDNTEGNHNKALIVTKDDVGLYYRVLDVDLLTVRRTSIPNQSPEHNPPS
jgi:hypothetical protein